MGICWGKRKKAKTSRKSHYSVMTHSEAQKALVELVETENNFGHDLKSLMAEYLDPLRAKVFFDNTELILFNSVCLDLLDFQAKFEQKLEATVTLEDPNTDLADIIYNVGDVFIYRENDFNIFSKYIVAMSRVQKVISGKSAHEKIAEFVEKRAKTIQAESEKSNTPNTRMMTMESLILKPLQRIMLYPLILERLEKQSEEGTCDKEQIEEAMESIKKVARDMNEAMMKDEKSGEEYQAMLKHYEIAEYNHKT